MTWIPDLSPWDYLWESARDPRLLSVGWLGELHEYPRGPVDRLVRDKLVAMSSVRWLGYKLMGVHYCELCHPDDAARGGGEIYVPGPDAVYVAPVMIVHYIDVHGYRPPAAFVEALERCPPPGSKEFLDAFEVVCPAVLSEVYPPRASWLERWRARRRRRRDARKTPLELNKWAPAVWEMSIAGGDRLFVDSRLPWRGPEPWRAVAPWRDAAREPVIIWIDMGSRLALRARCLTETGEQEPSIEDLVFTLWFLQLSAIGRGRWHVDERGIPIVSLVIETALGPVRFDRSQISTGNFVRIVTRAGELLAMRAPLSNVYDAKCLTLRPDGEGLLREIGRLAVR